MVVFRTKKIQTHQNIGEILKEAREKKGLSLNFLANQLQINAKFLQAIEDNDLQKLPGEFYIKIFVKKYADTLGVRFKKIETGLNQEIKIYKKWEQGSRFNPRVNKKSMVVFPSIFKKSMIAGLIVIILIYFVWQIWQITNPPSLEILQPVQGTITLEQKFYTIYGQTEPNSVVKINSQEVVPDDSGFFSLTFNLSPGSNMVKISAKTSYSRTAVIEKEIIVK
ncbi:MAG: helix-turn-helix domain-containing protein [Patescibacteria group bacterium]